MSTFPNSPRILKAGLALIDPGSGRVQRMISLQYNPDSLSRSLQVQGEGAEGGQRAEPLRLKGPAIETIKLEAEIDATDQLEFPDQNPDAVQFGIQPQLAALESLVNPTSGQLLMNNAQIMNGTLEIAPMEAPLALFVWGRSRVVPVRVTEFSITEEAFDTSLNPIRAKLSLGLRVLTVEDFPLGHRGAGLFLSGLQATEQLAIKAVGGVLSALGI
ncbi:MAG: hypothetical protein JWQ90_3000 [Hydrocarboniphaga sp.]|uniref:CIS tube protein n=1 Tax=Hydrocarboniphaga sp. TaxID=2033016 RepID=UPI0026225726|nr:hypothetical protein [Hydrocarboniphaga sp.]MDB5970550.1 hypothetical protein [Hydrocarboniphaga sp.]